MQDARDVLQSKRNALNAEPMPLNWIHFPNSMLPGHLKSPK